MQGLGKTVELLACLCANRFKGPRLPPELVSQPGPCILWHYPQSLKPRAACDMTTCGPTVKLWDDICVAALTPARQHRCP